VIGVLASELIDKSLWYPTVQGVLVIVAAVVLFCGSAYLLLATDVGARLGFLVAFTGLFGFLVLLSLLWVTTSSPLNTLKGRIPAWEVQGTYDTLDDQGVPGPAKNISQDGHKVDEVEAASVKAAVDDRLVKKVAEGEVEPAPDANEFAEFDEVTQYLVVNTYEIGGSKPNPLKLQFKHSPLYAVVEYCSVKEVKTVSGLAPPEPECAPAPGTRAIVLERDLGSIRLPPFMALTAFSILFGLGLLSLHWYEKDRRALQAGRAPVPVQS